MSPNFCGFAGASARAGSWSLDGSRDLGDGANTSRGAAGNTLQAVRKELGDVASVQLFSSENRLGIDEARAIVTRWLVL